MIYVFSKATLRLITPSDNKDLGSKCSYPWLYNINRALEAVQTDSSCAYLFDTCMGCPFSLLHTAAREGSAETSFVWQKICYQTSSHHLQWSSFIIVTIPSIPVLHLWANLLCSSDTSLIKGSAAQPAQSLWTELLQKRTILLSLDIDTYFRNYLAVNSSSYQNTSTSRRSAPLITKRVYTCQMFGNH